MRLDIRPYQRPFRQSLQTAHGLWSMREGLILRFIDEGGRAIMGEIAPIPWFGTETLDQARMFCDRWPHEFPPEAIADIPDTLPACQFGFSAISSWASTAQTTPKVGSADLCALLPTGENALARWHTFWQAGYRTFKWKIGTATAEQELPIFHTLVTQLPKEARLRLDANGGLTPETAAAWLAACDRAPITIEFLEQPLPPDTILDWLPQIRDKFVTAIALDESVATLPQLQQVHQQVGNQVVYVVKPAIAGFPQQLLHFCQQQYLDVVVSSALETAIGRNRVLQLAQALWAKGIPKRALGIGVGHWFADDWDHLTEAELWNQLKPF